MRYNISVRALLYADTAYKIPMLATAAHFASVGLRVLVNIFVTACDRRGWYQVYRFLFEYERSQLGAAFSAAPRPYESVSFKLSINHMMVNLIKMEDNIWFDKFIEYPLIIYLFFLC